MFVEAADSKLFLELHRICGLLQLAVGWMVGHLHFARNAGSCWFAIRVPADPLVVGECSISSRPLILTTFTSRDWQIGG